MIKTSLSQLQFVDRFAFIRSLCAGKRVLHLGATDYPVTKTAIEHDRFLHSHLCSSASYVVGLDLANSTIEWLKTEHDIQNIRLGNIERIEDYPSECFDVVVAGEIFEHLNNPGLALSAIGKFMRGKGSLVLTVPNAYSLKGFCRALVGHEHIHPDHVLHHSVSTLNALLQRHGFMPKTWVSYVNGGKGVVAQLANSLLRLRPQLAEGVGVVATPSLPGT